jgi:hypothetical protein
LSDSANFAISICASAVFTRPPKWWFLLPYISIASTEKYHNWLLPWLFFQTAGSIESIAEFTSDYRVEVFDRSLFSACCAVARQETQTEGLSLVDSKGLKLNRKRLCLGGRMSSGGKPWGALITASNSINVRRH